MRPDRLTLPIAALLLLAQPLVHAEVYRWVDEHGVPHYGDKPPKEGLKPVELPPLQTYSPGEIRSPAPAPAPAASSARKTAAIRITSPAQDDTLRDAGGGISLSVDAALADGQGIVYLLDGVAQNRTPTASSAWLFENVERGEHQLGAMVVDAQGRELARAGSVTVHVKPPIVLR